MTRRRITTHTAATAALLLAIGTPCGFSATGSAIGMVMTIGNFRVDDSRVWGNTTLFDGSVIETARAVSQVQLNSGIQMHLGAATRARIFQHRLVLDEGLGEMDAVRGFAVEARSLRITGASEDARARVRIDYGRRVLVAAVRGSLRISNGAGMVVARLAPGEAL